MPIHSPYTLKLMESFKFLQFGSISLLKFCRNVVFISSNTHSIASLERMIYNLVHNGPVDPRASRDTSADMPDILPCEIFDPNLDHQVFLPTLHPQ